MIRALASAVLLVLPTACGGSSSPPQNPAVPTDSPEQCVSSWLEHQSDHERGANQQVSDDGEEFTLEDDWNERYDVLASEAEGTASRGFRNTREFQLDGKPLLYRVGGRLFVNGAAFPQGLDPAPGTTFGSGGRPEVETLGVVSPAARSALGIERLLWFLIRAEVIRTYVHLGSKLCITRQTETDGAVTVRLAGTHEYATNQMNEDPIAFEVTVAADGTITLRRDEAYQHGTPEPPRPAAP